jgi:hypothetical protein
LEKFILWLSVQVVNTDTRDFISNIFDLDFFLRDLLIGLFCLLNEVSTWFFDCLLLRGMVYNIITNALGLGVELHDWFLKNLHLFINVGLFEIHTLRLFLSWLKRCL